MQTRPGRVGEHIKNKIFGLIMLNVNFISLVFLPPAAPFRLDFGRTVLQCVSGMRIVRSVSNVRAPKFGALRAQK